MRSAKIIFMTLALVVTLSALKQGQAAMPDDQERVKKRDKSNIEASVMVHYRQIRAAWTLSDPELTTENGRVKATLQAPRAVRWVKFYMSVKNNFTTFPDADYKFKLKCNKAKLCWKVGGPILAPGDVVFYGMQARFKRKRTYSFKGRIWVPFLVTTEPPTTTTNPTTISCNNLNGVAPSECTENIYTVPTGYPASGTGVRNPERGFYKHTETLASNWTPLTTSLLQIYLGEGYTLILRNFVLDSFVNSNMSGTILQSIRDDFATVRAAGMKVIVRFCYSLDQNVIDDAPPLQLQKHIEQLAPLFMDNVDVINVVQTGFIGVWGEWYYTANYGNAGVLSSSDWEKRRQVVYQLLDALPSSRQIQIRTPNFKTTILSRTSSVTSSEAYTDARVARTGHHNDCFLASATDFGTYVDKAVEYPYLQAETLYLAQGGETCAPNSPRSDCTTAVKELSELHFNYLNSGYHPDVLQSWITQGCSDQIRASLGYRLVGSLSRYPTQVTTESTTTVGIRIKNIGWASPINYRSAQLLLRHSTLSEEHVSPLEDNLDLRQWLPGDYDLDLTLEVPPSASAGVYKLYLQLPDGMASLQGIAEYNIVMENLLDSAEASRRLNLLGTITVV